MDGWMDMRDRRPWPSQQASPLITVLSAVKGFQWVGWGDPSFLCRKSFGEVFARSTHPDYNSTAHLQSLLLHFAEIYIHRKI